MPLQSFEQALFPKFLPSLVERFAHAVGVERESISWKKTTLPDRTLPPFGESQDHAGGIQPLDVVVVAQEKGGRMTTIRVAQMPRIVVVFGEEKSGVSAVGGVFAEQAVDRLEEALGLFQRERREGAIPVSGAKVAQVCLKIGHQERCSGSFA